MTDSVRPCLFGPLLAHQKDGKIRKEFYFCLIRAACLGFAYDSVESVFELGLGSSRFISSYRGRGNIIYFDERKSS